jgi:DNA-binding CsgD family transcriptional regulator
MAATWPLVGRLEELAFVDRAMNTPGTAGVVLAGAAGVGKTRLAKEILDRAEARGVATAWAIATQSASDIPVGALSHLLPDLARGRSQRQDLLRQAAAALAGRAGGRHLVLGIDDAHLLDAVSASLILHVAQTHTAWVVASVRTGEHTPDPIMALWKDGLAARLDLHPLSREETRDLLEAVLGSRVDGATFNRLWEATRGNALYLREFVLGGLDTSALVQRGGVWRWKGSIAPSTGLMEVVEARIGRLTKPARDALEVVATGEPLGLHVVATLAPIDVLESLERRGLIEIRSDGRRKYVRPSHPLYGEAIRTRTPSLRAVRIHSQLAEALSATGAKRREDLIRLATWKLEAGETDPGLFLPAARQAMGTHGYALAERLAAASEVPPNPFPATELRAHALLGLGQFEDADAAFTSLVESAPTELQRVEAAIFRAMNLHQNLHSARDAWNGLAEAEQLVSPQAKSEIAAMRGWLLAQDGRFDEADALITDLLDMPDATEKARIGATAVRIWVWNAVGRHKEALALVPPCLEAIARRMDELPFGSALQQTVRFVRTLASLALGRLDDAEAGEREAYAEAVAQEDPVAQGQSAWTLGTIYSLRGRARTAIAWLTEGAALLREGGSGNFIRASHSELAHCLAIAGRPTEAQRALQEAESCLVSYPAVDVHLLLAKAWVAAAAGETTAGRALARQAAELARTYNRPAWEASALHHVLRLGGLGSDIADRLAVLAGRLGGRLVPTFALHARAQATTDAPGLVEVSRAFEEMGVLLYAAEAAVEAARSSREEGRKGSAVTWAARARALADQCEGARTPALAEIDQPLPLTPRELEIGSMAARGLTNKEIAARLFVSVRTVDNHLHAIYAKLGIEGRTALSDVLGVAAGADQARPAGI